MVAGGNPVLQHGRGHARQRALLALPAASSVAPGEASPRHSVAPDESNHQARAA
jgi:hypothetical protein